MEVILKTSDIFNNESVNIFTDASVTKKQWEHGKETIGCPGFCTVINGNIVNHFECIDRYSTNNKSEILAIYYGILEAMKYQNFKYINLFSDSKISVIGLRDWFYNWTQNINNGIMFSTSGTPVSNQEIFLKILYTVIQNNIRVNLFHVKGHVNPLNKTHIIDAKKVFIETNYMKTDVEDDLISTICYYNNIVDTNTRNCVRNAQLSFEEKKDNFINFTAEHISYDKYNKFRKLIGR